MNEGRCGGSRGRGYRPGYVDESWKNREGRWVRDKVVRGKVMRKMEYVSRLLMKDGMRKRREGRWVHDKIVRGIIEVCNERWNERE